MRTINVEGLGWFPFISTAAPTAYDKPVGLTLTEAMRWYWKIAAFDFVVTLVHTDEFNTVTNVTGSLMSALKTTTGTAATKESDLTVFYNGGGTVLENWTYPRYYHRVPTVALTPGTQSLTVSLFRGMDGGIASAATWYPFIYVSVDGFSDPLNSTAGGSITSPATCTIDGFNVPLYHTPIVGAFTSGWTGTIVGTVTTNGYWPYAEPGGANPIYNVATGAQLLNPFDYQAST